MDSDMISDMDSDLILDLDSDMLLDLDFDMILDMNYIPRLYARGLTGVLVVYGSGEPTLWVRVLLEKVIVTVTACSSALCSGPYLVCWWCMVLGNLHIMVKRIVPVHLSTSVREFFRRCCRIEAVIVDVSAGQKETERLSDFKFVTRKELLLCYSESVGGNPIVLPDDRGEAVGVISKALQHFINKTQGDGLFAGVIGLGGTSLLSSFRSLPLGVLKLIVSTVASGRTEPYVKTSDLVLFPSIVDICGINSFSRFVLLNASAAFAGIVIGRLEMLQQPCNKGKKVLSFGQYNYRGCRLCSWGVMACDSSRFDVIIEKKIPFVLTFGALDMVAFGPKDTIPSNFHLWRFGPRLLQILVFPRLLLASPVSHDLHLPKDDD
ncbi:Detected protein of confused Function [Hibiscus syriacus]|uniref:Detected protein of confused Function n=1 Tax=Hibiscus syriacus TaxID=106335 RepID=A0A6A2ZUD4_HIBSY|nr:Detected protein of confused Function [Hibiscus syriacus]